MRKSILCVMAVAMMGSAAFSADLSSMLKATSAKAQTALVAVDYEVNRAEGESVRLRGVGVCIAKTGLFMTMAINSSIDVKQISNVTVTLPGVDGKKLPATLKGIDALTGVSFLKVDQPFDWSVVMFQGSAAVSAGDPVVSATLSLNNPAIPVQMGAAYVAGSQYLPAHFVQVTGGTLTRPGSVVFNAKGNAIGMVGTQGFVKCQTIAQGRAVQLPIRNDEKTTQFLAAEEFAFVIKDRPADGKVRSLPWIGVGGYQLVPEALAEQKKLTVPAVMLDEVIPGKLGDRAGLKNRDIVIAMNGKALKKFASPQLVRQYFVQMLLRQNVGKTVTLKVLRADGATKDISLVLEAMPTLPNAAPREGSRALGLALREKVMLDMYSKDPTAAVKGMVVMGVGRNSPAARSGLQAGDVVTTINGKAVALASEVKAILEALEKETPRKPISMTVATGAGTKTITMQWK